MKLKFKNPILHVNVTERDWKAAREQADAGGDSWECCPNALACNRALQRKFRRRPGLRAEVTGVFELYDDSSYIGDVLRPRFATRVVARYDSGRGEPLTGSFDIDLREVR